MASDAGACWQGPVRRGSGWLEWRLQAPAGSPLAEGGAAVFDPARRDLWCDFRGPGGRRLRVTAFWCEADADRGDAGEAEATAARAPARGTWRLRLLPPVPGRWIGRPRVRLDGGAPTAAAGRAFVFVVAAVPARQRIVVDAQDTRYFAFDDGTPFVPVGLNLCWSVGADVLADYRRWFERLAAQGGNFARLWMASWSFGIEWSDTGLGDYRARLPRAAQLDAVFELAEAHGIRLMLCLLNHGAFTERNDSEWHDNPYAAPRGGPLAAPQDFVTDERAIALFARRLRYIAARWAHSPALHSWEWWNEVTWTPIAAAPLRAWLQRLDGMLAAHDPYQRLRSSSWADRGDAQAWALPTLQFAQQHDYTTGDLVAHYAASARAWQADGVVDKPWLPGELGLHTTHEAGQAEPYPWDAVHLHNGLWAPLFCGYAGTALYWWWDQLVDPQDLWPLFSGASTWLAALQQQGLALRGHRPLPAQVLEADAPAHAEPRAGALALAAPGSLLLWVRSRRLDARTLRQEWQAQAGGTDAGQPWQPAFPPLEGLTVALAAPPLPPGDLCVQWFDADDGQRVGNTWMPWRGGELALRCPAFDRDVAAIVTPARRPRMAPRPDPR